VVQKFFSDYGYTEQSSTAFKELFISLEDLPPKYFDHIRSRSLLILITGCRPHVRLRVDLTKLPQEAWEQKRGTSGIYRRVHYYLGLCFGSGGVEWRFLYNGKVMGSAECEYIH
jgi:hypothetical protein